MFTYVLVCVTTNGTFSLKAFWDTFQQHTHLVHTHSRSHTTHTFLETTLCKVDEMLCA